jgi:formate/nitrite transporter FocA (FNT family)
MRKSVIRTLYLAGLAGLLVGLILTIAGIPGGTSVTYYGNPGSTPGNPTLFTIGLIIVVLAAIPMVIAWVMALVRTAQRSEWVWFVLLLVINASMLVYIFVPDPPLTPTAPLYQGQRPPMTP